MTSYSTERRFTEAQLRRSSRAGLPAWAQSYAAERLQFAHFKWEASRDRHYGSLRRDYYGQALQALLSLRLMLEAHARATGYDRRG